MSFPVSRTENARSEARLHKNSFRNCYPLAACACLLAVCPISYHTETQFDARNLLDPEVTFLGQESRKEISIEKGSNLVRTILCSKFWSRTLHLNGLCECPLRKRWKVMKYPLAPRFPCHIDEARLPMNRFLRKTNTHMKR